MSKKKKKFTWPRICSRCGEQFKHCSVRLMDRPEWEFTALAVGGRLDEKLDVETRPLCSICLHEVLMFAGFDKPFEEQEPEAKDDLE